MPKARIPVIKGNYPVEKEDDPSQVRNSSKKMIWIPSSKNCRTYGVGPQLVDRSRGFEVNECLFTLVGHG